MKCSGLVSIQVLYEGRTTDVLALVTPALQDEILLSWRTLQRLGVIPENFPHREVYSKAIIEKEKCVPMSPVEDITAECPVEDIAAEDIPVEDVPAEDISGGGRLRWRTFAVEDVV